VLCSRPRLRRGGLVIAAALSASLVLGSTASGTPKDPKVKINDGCTMLVKKEIKKRFGSPVVLHDEPLGCSAVVGADATVASGGRIVAYQEYPNLDQLSARAAVEDRHAAEFLGEDPLEDVAGVGKYAYVNRAVGVIVVQASKKFAFSLLWQRGGVLTINDADLKKLVKLAKDIVARSPGS